MPVCEGETLRGDRVQRATNKEEGAQSSVHESDTTEKTLPENLVT